MVLACAALAGSCQDSGVLVLKSGEVVLDGSSVVLTGTSDGASFEVLLNYSVETDRKEALIVRISDVVIDEEQAAALVRAVDGHVASSAGPQSITDIERSFAENPGDQSAQALVAAVAVMQRLCVDESYRSMVGPRCSFYLEK